MIRYRSKDYPRVPVSLRIFFSLGPLLRLMSRFVDDSGRYQRHDHRSTRINDVDRDPNPNARNPGTSITERA